MTRKEALEILKEVQMLDDSIYAYREDYLDALDIAIECLRKCVEWERKREAIEKIRGAEWQKKNG